MLDPHHGVLYNPLMIPELYHKILDCYHPESMTRSERKALVALARTCRTLSEPALDRLWRGLNSLIPLIRCYTSVDQVENIIPPTPSQFAVIDKHACRIQRLGISDKASVRFLQCMSTRPSCLFPRLMVLRWSPVRPLSDIIYIQRLLCPTPVSLEATLVEADGATLLSFLDNYPLLCRSLKSIKFRFSRLPESETTVKALSRAICSQKYLERVVLDTPVDSTALTYLCTLPTLKELDIHLSEGSRVRIELSNPPFCRAEELGFATSGLDLVTSLLRPGHQMFHSFYLHCPSRQPSEAFAAFLNSLPSRSHPNTLQYLFLAIGYASYPMPADQLTSDAMRYCLSYRTLKPLMRLGSLRMLVIRWSEQISLDDHELANLAGSWPFLEAFYIYCGRGGYPPFPTKYPTLLGLRSLVNSCPKLCGVALPLDAREVPEVEGTVPCKRRNSVLTGVEAPIDDARPVAEFLLKYLPFVKKVQGEFLRVPGTDVEQIHAYKRAWRQVNNRLQEFYGDDRRARLSSS